MRGAWFRGAPFREGGGGGKSKELGSEVQRCLAQGSSGQRCIHMFKGARVMGTPFRTSGGGSSGQEISGQRSSGQRISGQRRSVNPRRHRPFRILSRYKEGGGGATPSAVSPLIELELREKKSV